MKYPIYYILSLYITFINAQNTINSSPFIDVSQYTLYFKRYNIKWNNHDEWTWSSSTSTTLNPENNNNDTIVNQTISCSIQYPSLCINTEFTNKQIISLKLHYNNISLNFWNDLDWSDINILHYNPTKQNINRRQLLRGAYSSKYGNEYYDTISDSNNYYDYDEYDQYEEGRVGNWFKRGAQNLRNKFYKPRGCKKKMKCRVFLFKETNFMKKLGHNFCEGKWDRMRLNNYGVKINRVSSIKVQGDPCCVALVSNGRWMNGDLQAIYPRGSYSSMTTMGFRNKALASMNVFVNCKIRNAIKHRMRIVMRHGGWRNLRMRMGKLTQRGMPPGSGAGMMGMHGMRGMGMGMRGMGGMGGMMGMNPMMMGMNPMMGGMRHMNPMMMMGMNPMMGGMMGHCQSYGCVVQDQQSQLQHLMQAMMMAAMTSQGPITITDNTKKDSAESIDQRRRMILDRNNTNIHVIGIKKCKILYYIEICLIYDAINDIIELEYTVSNNKKITKNMLNYNSDFDDELKIYQHMVDDDDKDAFYIFDDIHDDKEMFDNAFDDNDQVNGNRYYDMMNEFNEFVDVESNNVQEIEEDVEEDDDNDIEYPSEEEREHRTKMFLGTKTYGMSKNELIYSADFELNKIESEFLINHFPDNGIIDYFDTFFIEYNNNDDWNVNNNNKSKCNDILLSFIGYMICIQKEKEINNDNYVIYFEKNNNLLASETVGFYSYCDDTKNMIKKEFDNSKFNTIIEQDWNEIYYIYDDNNNNDIQNKKLCNYIGMIKLCVSIQTLETNNNIEISIEYMSNEISKDEIKQMYNNNNNNWLNWFDFI